jgi:hypothetical protein
MKRIALITLILGTALAVAPAAQALVMSDGSGSSNGIVLHADVLGGNGAPATSQASVKSGDDSFAWDNVGIGAAALAGAMLLAVGSVAATRRRHQLGF